MANVNGKSSTVAANEASQIDNGLYHGSTSSAPLSIKDAVAHLETYKNGDGLSMSELVDSRLHGGLTYGGKCVTVLCFAYSMSMF